MKDFVFKITLEINYDSSATSPAQVIKELTEHSLMDADIEDYNYTLPTPVEQEPEDNTYN